MRATGGGDITTAHVSGTYGTFRKLLARATPVDPEIFPPPTPFDINLAARGMSVAVWGVSLVWCPRPGPDRAAGPGARARSGPVWPWATPLDSWGLAPAAADQQAHPEAEGVSDLLIWYSLLEAQCNQLCVGVP